MEVMNGMKSFVKNWGLIKYIPPPKGVKNARQTKNNKYFRTNG